MKYLALLYSLQVFLLFSASTDCPVKHRHKNFGTRHFSRQKQRRGVGGPIWRGMWDSGRWTRETRNAEELGALELDAEQMDTCGKKLEMLNTARVSQAIMGAQEAFRACPKDSPTKSRKASTRAILENARSCASSLQVLTIKDRAFFYQFFMTDWGSRGSHRRASAAPPRRWLRARRTCTWTGRSAARR